MMMQGNERHRGRDGAASMAAVTARTVDDEGEEHLVHDEGDDDDVERVVYYDLDDSVRRLAVRQSIASDHKGKQDAARRKHQQTQRILERPKELFAQHPVFQNGSVSMHHTEEASGDLADGAEEEEEEEESNPFAALLHAPPKQKKPNSHTNAAAANKVTAPQQRRPPQSPSPSSSPSPPTRSLLPRRVSPLKRATIPQPPPLHQSSSATRQPPAMAAVTFTSRRQSGSSRSSSTGMETVASSAPRSLAPTFEAADARPLRWTRNVPSTATATATKRRQSASSANALLSMRQADAKRRKSLPLSVSSLASDAPVGGGRRLSDVLHKATLQSSQQQRGDPMSSSAATSTAAADHSFDYNGGGGSDAREPHDGIADTVHEMRDEPFQTQFFSPSKLHRNGSSHRKSRGGDAVISKIRGSLGDAIRKATRKTNRDLTVLRSYGQTLLRQEQSTMMADDVHQRDFVVVRLDRRLAHSHMATYEASVDVVSLKTKLAGCDESVKEKKTVASPGMKLTVVFPAHDTHTGQPHQQFGHGSRVKVSAPFQIVNPCFVPGRRRKTRPFLVGTSLFEVLGDED